MALEPITRQEKIIAGQDLTPITRLEMFLKNFGGGGGSAIPAPIKTGSLLRGDADSAKWSEVDADGGYGYTDGQKTVIEWDGNESGKAEVYLFNVYYYNVSEKVPSSEELIGGIAVGSTETNPLTISSNNCATIGGIIAIQGIYKDLSILVVPNDAFHFEYSEGGNLFEADFPKKGVYFSKYPGSDTNFVHSLTYGNEIVHQIAEKYLPEVVRSGDKEIILSSSTANSTKKFQITVDDSGTISATEVT